MFVGLSVAIVLSFLTNTGKPKKNAPECAIPLPESVLNEAHVRSPGLYLSHLRRNTHEEQQNLQQHFESLNKQWKSAVACVCYPERADFHRCILNLVLFQKNSAETISHGLVRLAILCAGCSCCARHSHGAFQDSEILESHYEENHGCACPCRFLLRQINEIFVTGKHKTHTLLPTDGFEWVWEKRKK